MKTKYGSRKEEDVDGQEGLVIAEIAGPEAQILGGLLHYGVQLLSPIPDDVETALVKLLVRDAHELHLRKMWDEEEVKALLINWFGRGQLYEVDPELAATHTEKGPPPEAARERLVPIPENVFATLWQLASGLLASFMQKPRDEEAICRLLWLALQWGRSYQAGNQGLEVSQTSP